MTGCTHAYHTITHCAVLVAQAGLNIAIPDCSVCPGRLKGCPRPTTDLNLSVDTYMAQPSSCTALAFA